ncbi:hypothetical protein [Paenibacillus durus]|uniref:Uncharacterized protein n=1 Tax=Paenibacillus durus ATCC 35681 TaxID=1333534 RepID=A0A0F7FAU0_PAEDU|nr:hypothetical protein [Paenibacillus durus]AKG35830.1 hypothetical protein VK70_15660 [Paenibacillus durus ATCC 35681]
MKKAMIYFIGILLLMVAFSLLIYPTPYRYLQYLNAGSITPLKVNVITGKTMQFTPTDGWTEVKNKK